MIKIHLHKFVHAVKQTYNGKSPESSSCGGDVSSLWQVAACVLAGGQGTRLGFVQGSDFEMPVCSA